MVFRSRLVRFWDVEWVAGMSCALMVDRAEGRGFSEFRVLRKALGLLVGLSRRHGQLRCVAFFRHGV